MGPEGGGQAAVWSESVYSGARVMTSAGLLILASGLLLMAFAGIPAFSRRVRGVEVSSPKYKYWALGAIAVGMMGSTVDQGSVNIALPTIAGRFQTDLPTVQWVIIGYTLTITALLLPMGRLADLIGRKKVYLIGSLAFVVGAMASGSSSDLTMLIPSRIFQGVGAAMTQGTGMAIIISSFPPRERGQAIGLIMTTVGTGSVLGPPIGGLLVDSLGWPFVFFISVPIGLLAAGAALVVLEESDSTSGAPGTGDRFDWLGAALSTGALVALLMALTNGHRSGWASPPILVAILIFFSLLSAFVWWELRSSNPMLDLRLFRRRLFSFGVAAAFFSFLGHSAVVFLIPFYLQGVLGYNPRLAGLVMMPGPACMALMGPLSGMLSDRYGWRRFTIGSLASSATGLFLLSRLTVGSSLALVLPALMLTGAGQGAFYSPNSSSVISSVEPERYGIVAAFLHLVRNGANITSLAMATAIVTATMGSMGFEPSLEAVREATGPGVGYAFTVGLRNAFLVMMGLLVIGMAVSSVNAASAKELGAVTST